VLKIYLASPYTHDDLDVMEERYLAVCIKAAQLTEEGHYIYSPIAHWHPIAKLHSLPRNYNYWKAINRAAIEMHDEMRILKLEGWSVSVGIGNEILIAKEFNKPYSFIDP